MANIIDGKLVSKSIDKINLVNNDYFLVVTDKLDINNDDYVITDNGNDVTKVDEIILEEDAEVEVYDSKDRVYSVIESIKRFAKLAEVVEEKEVA